VTDWPSGYAYTHHETIDSTNEEARRLAAAGEKGPLWITAGEQTAAPESTAVRVALWRAMHVLLDAPPHVLEDELGLRLAAPADGWRARPDMDPSGTSGFRAAIVARARFIEDLVAEHTRWINRLHVLLRDLYPGGADVRLDTADASALLADQLGMPDAAAYDLSATPFFLSGSGYNEGTLFSWTMSDFSLMDAIECGIVKLPRVPVADNIPGSDVPKFRNLWEHIRSLRDDTGVTIVLTTHYLEEADALADRIMVMDGGLIVADDTPEALKARIAGDIVTLVFDGADISRAAQVARETITQGKSAGKPLSRRRSATSR